MIQQIDHILVIVPDLDAARHLWRAAGCPVLWNGVWNDPRASVPLFGISVGPLNLEILSAEASRLFGLAEGAFGVASVAFDPSDTQETVRQMREVGLAVAEPQPWRSGHTFVSSVPNASLPSGGINTPLGDTLPGLPAFLSEYLPPHQHRGRAAPDSSVQFVELTVRRPDPRADVALYERALQVTAKQEGADFVLPLRDTPLRLTSGNGCEVVVKATRDGVPALPLSEAVPGLRWTVA